MFVISLFHQSLQYICDDFRFENVLDMDRFCATRPVFSAPWLLSDRLRGWMIWMEGSLRFLFFLGGVPLISAGLIWWIPYFPWVGLVNYIWTSFPSNMNYEQQPFGGVWFVWANQLYTLYWGSISPTKKAVCLMHVWLDIGLYRLFGSWVHYLPGRHKEGFIAKYGSFYVESFKPETGCFNCYSQEPALILFAQTTILSKRWKTSRTIWQVFVAVTTPTKVATFSNLGAKFWFICSTGL